jgi:CO/xanthine dehydrogenase FAD-binding subunit
MWESTFAPLNVMQAIEILDRYRPGARIIAGGTDLIMQLQAGEKIPRCLVDISNIPELQAIMIEDDQIVLGACATHAQVSSSPLIQVSAGVLAAAAGEVGSPQIRSVGTIGGNVVNAQPAADTALALIALSAQARIIGKDKKNWIPVENLYQQPGISKIDSSAEILESFRFKIMDPLSGSAYRRLGKCKSIALPVICAAAVVHLDENGEIFRKCRLAIGPVGPTPCLANEATEWLFGKPVNSEVIKDAARIARGCAHPRSSLLRCSADYREQMVEIIVKSVLSKAADEAKMKYRQLSDLKE